METNVVLPTSLNPALPADIAKMHVSLNVASVENSVEFYERFFGVAAHKRRPGYANFDIANPPLKLALNESAPRRDMLGQLSHLGIQVGSVDYVEATRQRLGINGMISLDEGKTVCCFAEQDKVWATDPDGNGWEVYVLLDDMNAEDDDHDHDHSHWQAHGHDGKGTQIGCGCSTGLPLAMASPAAGASSCCTPTPSSNCC